MRRHLRALAALAAVIIAAAVAGPAAGQEQTEHPLIGAWISIPVDDPTAEPDLITFGADGNAIIVYPGGVAVGTWSPSGQSTGDITVVFPQSDESAYLGMGISRGSFGVSSDGESLTGTFTNEYPIASGGTTGQLGPIEVTATRIVLDPMGTPITLTAGGSPAPGAAPSE